MRIAKIPIADGYYVSENGDVISRKTSKERVMKQHIRGHGYFCVSLTVEEYKTRNYNVHSLMAMSFLSDKKDGYEVRHLDGNKLNNKLSNLSYDTVSENQMDRVEHGTSNRGESHGNVILTEELVLEIRKKYVFGKYGYKRLAKEYSIAPSTVQGIVNRSTWDWLR